MFRTEHNLVTGEIVEIPLSTAEATAIEKEWAAEAKRIADEKAEAEAKAAQRQALLSRLGITEEEARILLGGN